MKIKILNEMALKRKDAVDHCCSLGKQFVDHFHKCMIEGASSDDFSHHCTEMQAFWDKVKFIVLKPSSKLINFDDLINWFFTYGSDVEHVIKKEYQDTYEKLYLQLLNDRENSKVLHIMKRLLKNK